MVNIEKVERIIETVKGVRKDFARKIMLNKDFMNKVKENKKHNKEMIKDLDESTCRFAGMLKQTVVEISIDGTINIKSRKYGSSINDDKIEIFEDKIIVPVIKQNTNYSKIETQIRESLDFSIMSILKHNVLNLLNKEDVNEIVKMMISLHHKKVIGNNTATDVFRYMFLIKHQDMVNEAVSQIKMIIKLSQ
jgi:hypothetical protein